MLLINNIIKRCKFNKLFSINPYKINNLYLKNIYNDLKYLADVVQIKKNVYSI